MHRSTRHALEALCLASVITAATWLAAKQRSMHDAEADYHMLLEWITGKKRNDSDLLILETMEASIQPLTPEFVLLMVHARDAIARRVLLRELEFTQRLAMFALGANGNSIIAIFYAEG